MTTPAHQLRLLQKSLYDKAFSEAHAVVAGTSRTILSYSTKFEKSLTRSFSISKQSVLIDEMRRHQFMLYGDFHSLRQSQRGLLRIIRAYSDKMRTNKFVIAMETFRAADQHLLDAYMNGQIEEPDFLRRIRYATVWGFPWANFKMILDFARSRGIRVIGINTEQAGRDTLKKRDDFAASILVRAALEYPDHKIVGLIGEYHLADDHLPKSLRQAQRKAGFQCRVLRVLNNVDSYYFQLQNEPVHRQTEYLKLKRDLYCIMNSPPWVKWHSFSLWEEMRDTDGSAVEEVPAEVSGYDNDFDLYTDDGIDIDFQFLHMVRHLAGFIKARVDDSDLESFHVTFSPDGDFFKDLEEDSTLDPVTIDRILERAGIDGVYYLAQSSKLLLTHISVNNLAEGAGHHLHATLTGFSEFTHDPTEAFYRQVIKGAVGVLASKILNPRRQTPEIHHYKNLLRRKRGRRLIGAANLKRDVASAIVKFDKWIKQRIDAGVPELPQPPREILRINLASNFEVAYEIGSILGHRLYKRVLANKQPSSRIKRMFSRRIPSSKSLWLEIKGLYDLMISR